ncbi:putative aspartic-type endopeptidase OPSB [Fulvia fulva]|nr:putative aspartic-type endopeptidase OPSB [Fulvia fulva]WPV14569.1 putative aspartic-type endopeptidase OPSB [Fulvia fulva]WPV30558.1 putative aspartic-type endopeptidase OPSB [Fulvia fulva]
MRSTTLTPLLLASASALPELSISKRDKHNNGRTNVFARAVEALTFEKRQDGTVSTNVFNVLSWSAGGAYYTNITVGTPPQEQTVIIDTGSSDLYFDATSAATCNLPSTNANSCQGGTYDKTKSSSYKEVEASPAFNTSFGDGSSATGPYGSDVVGIGDIQLSPAQFGVAETVDSTTGYAIGLLGLGYTTNEAVTDPRNFYQNLPEVLKEAGVINSRLYSVYLNDARAYTGTVLFGGIDRSKYTGPLATVDLIPATYGNQVLNTVNQFITTITGLSTSVSGSNSDIFSGGAPGVETYSRNSGSLPVLLDTGSTAFSVSTGIYRAIVRQFSHVDRNGYVPCSYANSGDSISLEFDGKITIKVDASDFIVPLINSTTREPEPYNNDEDACLFLIQPSQIDGIGFGIAGDAVLRSMYVVFDLDNGQASIAQAAVNSTADPDIVTVAAGPTGVAAAVSGVSTPAPNSFSIAQGITTATQSYAASTVSPAVGQETGEGAIPAGAQVDGEDTGNGGGGGNGGKHSKNAAAGLMVPKMEWSGVYVVGIWMMCVMTGVGVMV